MTVLESQRIRESIIFKDLRKKDISSFNEAHYERREDPFELVYVDCPYLLKNFGKLRHQVYIEEKRMPLQELKTIKSSLDHVELDEYDDQSDHYLLNFKPLDLFVGGIRLILPDHNKPYHGIRPLKLSPELLKTIGEENSSKSYEISRLLLSKVRLKIIHDYLIKNKLSNNKNYPNPLLHLFKPIYEAYKVRGLVFATLIGKPSLIKTIQHLGFDVISVGDQIDYNGKVQPAYLDLAGIAKKIESVDPKLIEFLSDNYAV